MCTHTYVNIYEKKKQQPAVSKIGYGRKRIAR